MQLSVPSGLRLFIAEHRTYVKQFCYIRFSVQLILDIGPHDACRSFRAQGHASLPFIQERIHLLLYDIRSFPDTALKQFRLFEDRRANLLIVESAAEIPRHRFKVLPLLHRTWQKVLGAFRFLKCHFDNPLAVDIVAALIQQ